jgi:hypothetical protein
MLKAHFSGEALAEIAKERGAIKAREDQLVLGYTLFNFKNEQTREYAHRGFMRRIGTLHRCIENVFRIVTPERMERPTKSELDDAQINLQAFYANVYGAADNLAWIWVLERGLKGMGRGESGPSKEACRSTVVVKCWVSEISGKIG